MNILFHYFIYQINFSSAACNSSKKLLLVFSLVEYLQENAKFSPNILKVLAISIKDSLSKLFCQLSTMSIINFSSADFYSSKSFILHRLLLVISLIYKKTPNFPKSITNPCRQYLRFLLKFVLLVEYLIPNKFLLHSV